MALVLGACGDNGDDPGDSGASAETSTPGATGEATPTAEADRASLAGGELTVQYIEFQSFDPHFSAFTGDIGHQGMVFRGLYDLSADNRPVPLLADADPNVSADGLVYTVSLREGLEWSDGDALTAEDFVAGIQRTCSWKVAGAYRGLLDNVVGCAAYANPENEGLSEEEQEALRGDIGVTAQDDHTIVFELENPQPTFTLRLAMWIAWPVPTHVVEHPGDEWPAPEDLVFNGPFVVESYEPGVRMVLARNERYAGNTALLDRLTLRYVDDAETANNAFRTGELAMASANVANLTALQQEFADELVRTPMAATMGLMMNLRIEPLDQVEVRQAISKAIDRETLVNVVLQEAHVPTTTWAPPDIVGVEPNGFADAIGYDPEGARALLADAGFPDGEGFPTLEIVVADTGETRTIAEFLQEQLRQELGIETEISVVDGPERAGRLTSGTFELYPGGFLQDYPDPENWLAGLFATEGSMNFWGCSDEEIDTLIEAAQFNRNESERRDQYRQVNELVVERVCGIAPYHHTAGHYLVAPEVGGARERSDSKNRVLPGDWAAEEWHVTGD